MNTKQWKIAALVVTIVLGGILQTAKASGPPILTVEKADISKDLQNISNSRAHISTIKGKIRDERASGVENIATHKELAKANADYMHAKAYLKADKRDMLYDHMQYISLRRHIVATDYMALVRNSFEPIGRNRTREEKTAALQTRRQQAKQDQKVLHAAIIARNDDLLAVNKQIEQANGLNYALLRMENTSARAQNYALAVK